MTRSGHWAAGSLARVFAIAWLAIQTALSGAEADGLALAVVYDTSGSMRDPVRDTQGGMVPKFTIANRALVSILQRLEEVSKTAKSASGDPLPIEAGLFIFDGSQTREAVKFGPFEPAAMRKWVSSFSSPAGPTPLGEAVKAAGNAVLKSRLNRKHVLVLTDGINTAGPEPSAVIAGIMKASEKSDGAVFFHFVAFDIDARVFEKIKKQGATVLGASDGKQLSSQLEFILEEKILLEKEESPKKLPEHGKKL